MQDVPLNKKIYDSAKFKQAQREIKRNPEKYFKNAQEYYMIPDKGFKGTKYDWVKYKKEMKCMYDNETLHFLNENYQKKIKLRFDKDNCNK